MGDIQHTGYIVRQLSFSYHIHIINVDIRLVKYICGRLNLIICPAAYRTPCTVLKNENRLLNRILYQFL